MNLPKISLKESIPWQLIAGIVGGAMLMVLFFKGCQKDPPIIDDSAEKEAQVKTDSIQYVFDEAMFNDSITYVRDSISKKYRDSILSLIIQNNAKRNQSFDRHRNATYDDVIRYIEGPNFGRIYDKFLQSMDTSASRSNNDMGGLGAPVR